MNILSFFAHRSRKRALRLYDEAWERLHDDAYEEALAIARKLRKVRFSGAYEIEGRAYMALDRDEDAVRVLREGVAVAPSVWINWLLLGSALSNVGGYDEALLAYDRAAACEETDLNAIALNRAVVTKRLEDPAATLRNLDAIEHYEDEEARLRAVALRVSALRSLDRLDEAASLGVRTLRDWRNAGTEDGKGDVGRIALTVGMIHRARGENTMLLRAQAIDWWRATHHDDLLWLVRDLRAVRSPDAQYFRLTLHGTISPDSALRELGRGFLKATDVVADSPDEALSLYMELDPPELGVELEIRNADVVEARPDEVKGVYAARWGRVFYAEE